MPLGLYAKHETKLLLESSGCAEDITKTTAFKLMTENPDSKIIINRKHN